MLTLSINLIKVGEFFKLKMALCRLASNSFNIIVRYHICIAFSLCFQSLTKFMALILWIRRYQNQMLLSPRNIFFNQYIYILWPAIGTSIS